MTSSDPAGAPVQALRFAQLRRTVSYGDGARLEGMLPDGSAVLVDVYGQPQPALPAELREATLTREPATGADAAWRLHGPGGEWRLAAPAVRVFVHRPFDEALRRVVAPRAVPLRKRILWRVVPLLLSTRAGRALLGAPGRSAGG